jgi:hypothetical protein
LKPVTGARPSPATTNLPSPRSSIAAIPRAAGRVEVGLDPEAPSAEGHIRSPVGVEAGEEEAGGASTLAGAEDLAVGEDDEIRQRLAGLVGFVEDREAVVAEGRVRKAFGGAGTRSEE